MYSTCINCHAPLGANEMIERFPVGRRLAFDAARGRLWVVCRACKQWNLSPLDERWEAIESAEKLYRDTKLRVSTEHVGLARLRDGTELIRIGEPLRPEFAAWRYGERFTVRWKKYTAMSALFAGGALAVGPLTGLGFSLFPYYAVTLAQGALGKRRVIASVPHEDGRIALTKAHAELVRIEVARDLPSGWRLSLPALRRDTAVGRLVRDPGEIVGRVIVTGDAALDAARRLLPHVNVEGARRHVVDDAVQVLEETGDASRTFIRAAQVLGRDGHGEPSRYLSALPLAVRLALEMATHEEIERRALDGELETLQEAWKQAEEIAAIADALTLPERVAERWARLTGR